MEQQQRIIFTVTNDLNTDQRMQRICNTLQLAGFDVLLVGRRRRSSVELTKQSFLQKRLNCWFEKGIFFYAEFNLRLFFFLLFSRVDIIGSIDADTLLPGTLVSEIRSKKLVFDAHEYFTEVPELVNRRAVKKCWQLILNFCVPKSAACYTVGPALAELFSAQYHIPFDVIYNMPVQREHKPQYKANNVVLYQGDLNIGRGLEETIEAVVQTNAELWIAGNGAVKQQLADLVHKKQLSHRVHFLGSLLPEKLSLVTQQAMLGINLLDEVSLSYQYSIANKFFDYVQCSVPVLCADFIEYRTLNQQYEVALLCNNTVTEISAAINKLLTDKLYYQKLLDNCKLASQRWNWQSQEHKLIGIYRNL